MNTTTITRFGNMPAAQAMPQAAPAPQPVPSQPSQDIATFSTKGAAAPAAAPAIRFQGKLGDAMKGWLSASKDSAAASFDLKAERKRAGEMVKQRQLIPKRIRDKREELIQRKKAALEQVTMQHGPLQTMNVQQRKMESVIKGLEAEQEALYDESLQNSTDEALQLALGKEMVRLETEINQKQAELAKHIEKKKGREAIVEMFDMQLEVIEEAIKDANEMLDEAQHAFEMAKLYEERLKVEEELSLSSEGVLGEIKKLHGEATSYEGEKKAAVEHYIGMSVEEQLEQRRAKKQLDKMRTERQEQNALDVIKKRIAEQRAAAAAEAEGEQTATKTKSANG